MGLQIYYVPYHHIAALSPCTAAQHLKTCRLLGILPEAPVLCIVAEMQAFLDYDCLRCAQPVKISDLLYQYEAQAVATSP